MGLRVLLWLSLVLLSGLAASADIPYVFKESTHDIGEYDSQELVNISRSSSELAGVPPISSPRDDDVLLFPASGTGKTVGEIKNYLDYRLWQREGQILFGQGRIKEALQAIDHSIEINPMNAESWNCKGIVLMATLRSQEALRCFEVAVALEPSFAAAWINKAKAHYAAGQFNAAIQACDQAIQLKPNSPEAWRAKALMLKREAYAAFARARELA